MSRTVTRALALAASTAALAMTMSACSLLSFSPRTSAFEGYAGIPFEESALDYTILYPSPGSWEQGDHEIICFIISGEGTDVQLSGSMKGSNR